VNLGFMNLYQNPTTERYLNRGRIQGIDAEFPSRLWLLPLPAFPILHHNVHVMLLTYL